MSSGSREFALGLFVNLVTSRPLVGTFSQFNFAQLLKVTGKQFLQGPLHLNYKVAFSVNSVHISKMSIFQPTSFVTKETRMLRNRVFLT